MAVPGRLSVPTLIIVGDSRSIPPLSLDTAQFVDSPARHRVFYARRCQRRARSPRIHQHSPSVCCLAQYCRFAPNIACLEYCLGDMSPWDTLLVMLPHEAALHLSILANTLACPSRYCRHSSSLTSLVPSAPSLHMMLPCIKGGWPGNSVYQRTSSP